MEFKLFISICIVATACCHGLDAEPDANFKNCPNLTGQSMLDIMDKNNSGVERLVVYFYRARNKQSIIAIIPSKEYQDCMEDIPGDAVDSMYRYDNDKTIQLLFDRSTVKSMRYSVKPTIFITDLPEDNWQESWNKNEILDEESRDDDPVVTTAHSPADYPEEGNRNNKQPTWQIPVEQPNSYEVPEWPHETTSYSNNEPQEAPDSNEEMSNSHAESINFPGEIDPLPYNGYAEDSTAIEKPVEEAYDQKEQKDFNGVIATIRPDRKSQSVDIESNEVPVFQSHEENIAAIHPDSKFQPIRIVPIKAPVIQSSEKNIEPIRPDSELQSISIESNEAPVFQSNEKNTAPIRPDSEQTISIESNEAPVLQSSEKNTAPIRPDSEQPISIESNEAPVFQSSEQNHAPFRPDSELEPISIESDEPSAIQSSEKNITPIRPDQPISIESKSNAPLQPQQNSNTDSSQHYDEIQHHSTSGQEHDFPPLISDGVLLSSKEMNEDYESKNRNTNSLIIPKRHHDINNIKHENSDDYNEGNQELITNVHKRPYHNQPSKEHAQSNLVYKWHNVRVPRIDSDGKIYAWVWQRVKQPIRSESVKFSYWENSGKKHHSSHWQHKSSSKYKSVYHQSLDNDVTVANFDLWLKKQFETMQNNGNKMPSGAVDLYTVRLAIEQTLKTNGIRFKSGGKLIDADGHIFRLDNVNLRPIYIGRSLAYDRIWKNSGRLTNYKIPANTPFLKGLLVSLISPPKTLGIVPLGITAMSRLQSSKGNLLFDRRGFRRHDQVSGNGNILPKVHPKVLVKGENVSSSEEKPGFRIIGGSFAVGTGTPLANRGRSGRDHK